MVQRRSLLSSTLVLGSQDVKPTAGDRQGPAFGEPFRFGKPLLFNRAVSPDDLHDASKALSLQLHPHSGYAADISNHSGQQSAGTKKLESGKQDAGNRQHQLTSEKRSPSKAAQVQDSSRPQAQQHGDQQQKSVLELPSCAAGNSSNTFPGAEEAAAASKYYLGCLGAALVQGYASPAATAAAISATAAIASHLAATAAQLPHQTTSSCGATCRMSQQDNAGGLAAQARNPQTAALGPAASAAVVAAAAACGDCQGCRMMLQRLQTCSHCMKHKQSAAAAGSSSKTAGGDAQSSGRETKRKAPEDDETPGPGQYNVPSSFGQGAAFTIGERVTAAAGAGATADDIPGPGSYYNPKGLSSGSGPAFSIRGRWKEPGQDAAAPGPGEHQQLAYTVDGPAFTIASKRSCKTQRSSSPGPGAYAPDWDKTISSEGPAYSMGGRLPDPRARSASPGPAEYQKTEFRPEGPAYSFPAKPKTRPKTATEDGPAPTDYEAANSVAASSRIKSAPAYTFSSKHPSVIDQMFKDLFPGPGSYYVSDTGPSGPAFSMGTRPEGKTGKGGKTADEPGPGEYYTETVIGTSGPAFTLGGKPSSPKAAADSDSIRGPGMYYNPQAEAALQGAVAFTIGTRLAADEAVPGRDSPGPASYNMPAEQTGPAITIGTRAKQSDKAAEGPGPAAYDTRPAQPEGPAFTMGKKPREKAPTDDDGPAVGEYDVVVEAKGPAWTLGARREAPQDKQAAELPGPGQYHYDQQDASGPAWSMAGRLQDPAADPERAATGPGPGEHHPENWTSLAGPAFSLAGKVAAADRRADSPGPGAYLASDFVDPAAAGAPAYTMGTRPAPQEPESTLGPGAFDLPELPKGPAFTVGTRPTAAAGAADTTPGPAAYNVAGAAAALDAATPAWTMGQRSREQSAGSDSPAPGDYSPANPSAAAAPAWTMGTKAAALDAAAAAEQQLQPGPGYYAPVDPVKEGRGAAFSIAGKWKESAAGGADSPAPGAYDLPTGDSGPAYSLAGRTAAAATDTAATPAPGQYHVPTQPGTDTPAYTIAGKPAAGGDAASAATDIGPGAYDVGAAYAAVAAAAPAYTLAGKGRPNRQAAAGTDSPGVGAYDVTDTAPAGPSYSIGMRLADPAKAADGPSPGDYHTEAAVTSTILAAPAYTMRAKAPEPAVNDDVPAPGTYHGPATVGAPPHAPAAPAYSIQGKHKKGKSRLRQMLGKLADIDAAEPGPGEHQPTGGGSTALSGPKFTFGPSAGSGVGGAAEGGPAASSQTLAQLQAQLARLLVKETQQATRKANKSAAAARAHKGSTGGITSDAGQVGEQPQGSSHDLAAISASVHEALLLSRARRSKHTSSSKQSKDKDYASPAPGDHYAAAGASSFGTSGPAYTMAGKGSDSTSVKTSVADADGFPAVMAAAAAADRAAAVPGPGMYHVEKPFPHPEGQLVYKPILKKSSSSGGSPLKRVSFSGGRGPEANQQAARFSMTGSKRVSSATGAR